jgi:Amidohydrolase family
VAVSRLRDTLSKHSSLLRADRQTSRLLPKHGAYCDGDRRGRAAPFFVLQFVSVCLDRYSMLRIGLAPCSPFTVTNDLMISAARIAREYEGVRLHTHLAENAEDVAFSVKTYNARPGEYLR